MPSADAGPLRGRRVVIVGASAGIGRAFAVAAVRAGADVVVSARRPDALEQVVAEAGGGTAAPVDVADPASRARWCSQVAGGGAVDLVLVTVGMADLSRLETTDDAAWSATLATNLVGIARLLDEVRPVLAPSGILAAMSSETGRRPRRGLVAYAASKVGLEAVLAGLRVEHPGLRVSCIVVGATFPTEFGVHFGAELGPAIDSWTRHGILQDEFMVPEDVASVLVEMYGAALRVPAVNLDEVVLRSPSPVMGEGEAR